jgi:hypothetical protein
MAQPMDQMIEHFTRIQHIISEVNYRTHYLPNGYIHRGNDMPAIEYEDGTLVYMQMNLIHRNNDKPAIITKSAHVGINGCPAILLDQNDRLVPNAEIWFNYGMIHRHGDKPACVAQDGRQMWYKFNKRHRDDIKPACIYPCGRREYFIAGREYMR